MNGPASRAPLLGLPLAVVAAALALRAWRFGELGLDHYDEGVYAVSAGASSIAGLFPGQVLYSPPLYFGLVGLIQRGMGLAIDAAAIGLNVALGTLTVALIGIIGSRWFGRAAGWSAATLLSLSEYHIGLSRSGLTDVAFAFLFTLALFAVVEALRSQRLPQALLAGLAVGLAWNTKYHGWLAAAVAGLAALPWLARERGPWRRAALTLALVALVATICYLPWVLLVESQPGGYAALAKYQSGMLRPGWLSNLVRQARFQLLLDGPVSKAGCVAALAVAWLAQRRGGGWRAAALAAALAAATALLGSPLALVVWAAAGVVLLARRGRGLPGLAVVAWLLVWLVLTPLYRPYARLALPGVVAACLGAGLALSELARGSREGGRAGPVVAALCAAAILAFGRGKAPSGDPWRASAGLREAARGMQAEIPAGARVYVLGEPALAYYLSAAGRLAEGSVQGVDLPDVLSGAREPAWVVIGRYARSTGAEQLLVDRLGKRLGTELRLPFVPKDLRVLDDNDPWNSRHYRERPDGRYDLVLRRVEPVD